LLRLTWLAVLWCARVMALLSLAAHGAVGRVVVCDQVVAGVVSCWWCGLARVLLVWRWWLLVWRVLVLSLVVLVAAVGAAAAAPAAAGAGVVGGGVRW